MSTVYLLISYHLEVIDPRDSLIHLVSRGGFTSLIYDVCSLVEKNNSVNLTPQLNNGIEGLERIGSCFGKSLTLKLLRSA